MKKFGVILSLLLSCFFCQAQGITDSTYHAGDSSSFLWPFGGTAHETGWIPREPDPFLFSLVTQIKNTIEPRWDGSYVRIARCQGDACRRMRFFGSAPYVTGDTGEIFIIYYDPGYDDIKTIWTGSQLNIALTAIISHEIGHIIHSHFSRSKKPTPALEYEADKYMGKVMFRVWKASREEAVMAVRKLADESSSTYHTREQRILDVLEGYSLAEAEAKMGHADQRKSALYAMEKSNKSVERLTKSNNDAFQILTLDSVKSPFDPRVESPTDFPKITGSTKKWDKDSLTVVESNEGYKLCNVSRESGTVSTIGTVVRSPREDYRFMIYDETFYYWYVSRFREGVGYEIYSLGKDSNSRTLIATINTRRRLEFDEQR